MIRTFTASPPTVGVELEWQLVDRTTLDLREGVLPLMGAARGQSAMQPKGGEAI